MLAKTGCCSVANGDDGPLFMNKAAVPAVSATCKVAE
jgi:hypothetical protein